jgi:PKD repeat protein
VNLLNITATKNTFSNSADGSGSTIFWNNYSEVTFKNCLIQGNVSASIERSNNNDQLVISNSNIKGLEKLNGLNPIGLIVGEGNYDAMPNFDDFDNDNFSLSWPSYPDKSSKPKEIDGGIPSIHDEDGSISDIGAIIFDQSGAYFPPSAWFSAEETKIQSGTKVQFLNNSQKGSENIASYSWDFGDGNTSTYLQ